MLVPAALGAAGTAWLAERGLTHTVAMDRQSELDRLADRRVEIMEKGG
ncbi:MAG TPA: hypothetical protein VGA22_09085 [Gemmatimonadales bacterium]|jgi:hypothetical protein